MHRVERRNDRRGREAAATAAWREPKADDLAVSDVISGGKT
jgi:hypothetical protein